MAENDRCGICTMDSATHKVAEESGNVNHGFSATGKLIPPNKNEPKAAPVRTIIAVPDLALRALLVRKGVITSEDLAGVDTAFAVGKPDASAG